MLDFLILDDTQVFALKLMAVFFASLAIIAIIDAANRRFFRHARRRIHRRWKERS